MKLTNCNCGKNIICGCTASFDTYQNNTISVLSVGNLVGGSCTLDEYVIDWYRDGVHALVSGKGYDPDIQAHHPFTGDESIPVAPGQWQPVLRYVVTNGQVLYPKFRKCKNFCTSLDTQLPVITVTNLMCGMTIAGARNNYDYVISYVTSQDFSMASRTIRMYLDPSGGSKFLAIAFNAYNVADQIDVFYNEETTPLQSFIVGTNLVGHKMNVTPQEIDVSELRFVVDVSSRTYQSGDYIRIEVTPSVKEPSNYNTLWRVNMKCLPESSFECGTLTTDMRKIKASEVVSSYNSAACRYEYTFETVSFPPSTFTSSNIYKYLPINLISSAQISSSQNVHTLLMNYNRSCISYSIGASPTFSNASGIITVVKAGNVLTLSFTEQADYTVYKTIYTNVSSNSTMTDYSPDNTDINHYKRYTMSMRMAEGSCGDSYISKSVQFHISSPVVFDDVQKTITITMLSTTNGLTDQPCDTSYSFINTWINSINNSIAQADFSLTTVCRPSVPFQAYYTRYSVSAETQRIFYRRYTITPGSTEDICGQNSLFVQQATGEKYFYTFYVRLTITDQNAPLDNFRLESQLDSDTGQLTGTWVTVYEKQNGQQIIP